MYGSAISQRVRVVYIMKRRIHFLRVARRHRFCRSCFLLLLLLLSPFRGVPIQ